MVTGVRRETVSLFTTAPGHLGSGHDPKDRTIHFDAPARSTATSGSDEVAIRFAVAARAPACEQLPSHVDGSSCVDHERAAASS